MVCWPDGPAKRKTEKTLLTCLDCGQPTRFESDGTEVHLLGVAAGSFICHFDGDPDCDCWSCEGGE